MVQWCFEAREDQCIYMLRDGKDLGHVVDVKVADLTKLLIAVSFIMKYVYYNLEEALQSHYQGR